MLYKAWKPGTPVPYGTDHEPLHRLRSSLELRLLSGMGSDVFVVAGYRLDPANVALNTALVAGSDPIKLAAKIHGWCEAHAWVDGPDRAWLADLIDEGLEVGIYRRGIWYAAQPDTPHDKWSSQGWEEVQAHLRSRDDEPAVMSYSVCDGFPNAGIAGWTAVAWPDDVERTWDAYDKVLTEEQQRAVDDRGEAWYELDDAEQWRLGMEGLRTRRPWAQLTPDTLGTTFGPGVTVYDLLASDRDERVVARFAAESPVEQEASR